MRRVSPSRAPRVTAGLAFAVAACQRLPMRIDIANATARARQLQAVITGGIACAVAPAAEVLYEVGGKEVLPEAAQGLARQLVGESTPRLFGAGARAVRAAGKASGALAASSAKVILRGVVKASLLGAGVDLALSGARAIMDLSRGEIGAKDALIHVARETGKGGVSSAAGLAVTAGAIALLGPLTTPVLLTVGVGVSLATRTALDAVDTPRALRTRSRRDDTRAG